MRKGVNMKRILFILLLCTITLCGCGKSKKEDIINDLQDKISKMSSYELKGLLSISNNEDTYNYDVSVAYKENDNYRVSIINKSNNHEQIILKSNDEVYVITPSLNKSFKFQSTWPLNNSQIYILKSILNDINNDTSKTVEEVDDEYVITTKVNYPNNIDLVKQKIFLDKNANIKKIDVINNDGIIEMTMSFNELNKNPSFNDDFFNLDSIISNIDVKDEDVSLSIDNIVYPLYVPTGTSLTHEEKITKEKGERVILTFDGEKPFLLVEETANIDKDFSIVPIFGEPSFLNDTLGAITDNSLSWTSGGIDYYIVSDVMGKAELIEIANSISSIPIMK
jgi:outer membrane lipoprotein-sorting protein